MTLVIFCGWGPRIFLFPSHVGRVENATSHFMHGYRSCVHDITQLILKTNKNNVGRSEFIVCRAQIVDRGHRYHINHSIEEWSVGRPVQAIMHWVICPLVVLLLMFICWPTNSLDPSPLSQARMHFVASREIIKRGMCLHGQDTITDKKKKRPCLSASWIQGIVWTSGTKTRMKAKSEGCRNWERAKLVK